MRKVQKLLISLVLVVMTLAQGPLFSAIAQESTTLVDVSVFLQVEGKEPMNQQDYLVYEILQADTKEVLWEFRADNPPEAKLRLARGNYILRLYDGQGFVRDGSSITPSKVEQSIPQRNEQEIAADKKMKTLSEKGHIHSLADGNIVYELPFAVELGADLIDDNTGEMITKLVVHLTDETSQSSANEPTQTTGTLIFHVIDEEGVAIKDVVIEANQQTYTTDDSGQIRIPDVVGELPYQVITLPEGYEGTLTGTANVVAEHEHTIEMQISKIKPERGTVTFNVKNQSGSPVKDAVITLNDQAHTTDEQGQVVITDLESGQYAYTVTQLPEGYGAIEPGIVDISANQNVTVELQVTEQSQPQEAKLTIKVKNQENQGIANVVLTVVNQELTTDESGEVSISLPVGQTHGYGIISVPAGYESGAFTPTEILLEKETLVEITLPSKTEEPANTGDLTFVITDDKNNPLPNITVKLGEQQLVTDANGLAPFVKIPEGEYTFELLNTVDYKVPDMERTITIQSGQNMQFPIQLAAQVKHGNIRFKVHDQDGKPVVGAGIIVADREILTDEQGNAPLNDLPVGEYSYHLSKLPEGYKGEALGAVQVVASETKEISIQVERPLQLSTAKITVLDDKGNPAPQVKVAFGGLSGVTNEHGVVEFISLEPGKYYYSITEVPVQYQASSEQKEVTISEGMTFTDQLALTLKPAVGYAEFKVVDSQQQPVAQVAIKLGDQTLRTNENGVATFEVAPGNFTYQVIEVPATFQLDATQHQVQVELYKTSAHTIQLKTKGDADSSSQQVPQGTQVFVDDATGISIKVSAADARNIVKLIANKLLRPTSPEPQVFKGKEVNVYELKLVNRSNQVVSLTSVAEVAMPAPADANSLSVVKVESNAATANMSFDLIKGKIVMRTQTLGTFAIVYNKPVASTSSSQSSSSVTVTKTKRVEAKKDLPKTGESVMWLATSIALLMLIGGSSMLFYRKRISK